jgi:HEAT repeat protein
MDFTMPYTPDVETCRSVRTADEIRSDLEHDDPAVRAEACHQLGSSDDPQAFWLLARLLRADNGLVRGTFLPIPVRAYAAQALGRLADPRAVDHLCRALADRGDERFWDAVQAEPFGDLVSYDDVNAMAAEALGRIADLRALTPLSRAARRHPSPVVRAAAARALGEIRNRRPEADIPEEMLALARRSRRLDRERLEAALANLAMTDPELAQLLREESE